MNAARISRPCPRHRGRLVALLAASAALVGGTQALAPVPAAAVVKQGEECDPNLPSSDCEPDNGGGGDSSGGGGQGADGGPIVGEETIEIHDTPPSPCAVNPFACLPREVEGRPQVTQADRGPRLPRRGGRPVRVGEAPDARECGKLASTLNAANVRIFRVEVVLNGLLPLFHERVAERVAEVERQIRLMNLLSGLRSQPDPDPATILGVEEQVVQQMARSNAMLAGIEKVEDLMEPLRRQRADLLGKAHAAKQGLKRCATGDAGGDAGAPGLPPQRGDVHV